MAKGFKHGAGGGAPLNFKVVGNPQPASPKENTIWVNTDVEITGWVFSASEPENPTEGMVWFSTVTFSAAPFNALKKNGVMVYPMSAKQYVIGAWVDVSAMSYQNGKWVNWAVYLYGNGDKCEDITGGWTDVRTGACNIAWNGDGIRMTTLQSSSRYCSTYNNKAINVSGYTKLYAKISDMSVGTTVAYVAIGLRKSAYTGTDSNESKKNWNAVIMPTSTNENQQLLSVDISNIDGDHYIQIVDYASDVTVHEIYLI